ncbi:tRNA (N6-threonylcarbamoyladenosine(37)-N6)-methyltransferase TrmO [Neisseria sp. WLZKY-1]|uniref:tRNA (N6-threonylcarbamoyladenosine(37)-N6)-methyltransferase TrmO n=1 Tax=Neisseria sp. WLZKY-1 TaxID=3390377 RepID=UPI00397CE638
MRHTIETIGRVVSPYTQKFGIARQPGLVPAAEVRIVLEPRFGADSVRGLETFGYIWLHFIFHGVLDEGWSPLVRPPRLGGKRKMGVFATRSPHRPNHLGLSLLKLEGIDCTNGVSIRCSGADLLDGTPVVDIKPYIPFVEAKPDAASGFAGEAPPLLDVVWQTGAVGLSDGLKRLIAQSVAQDPRPAYQDIPERIYVMEIAGLAVKFRINGRTAVILSAEAV